MDKRFREALHGQEYVHRFATDQQIGRVERLLHHIKLPPNADIMDVGCGTGILAEVLATSCVRYTGVDFSEAMVRQARENAFSNGWQHCNFICGDAVKAMRERPCHWDAIFMLDISEHVPDGEWSEIVEAAKMALKPGGTAYLHTPNLDFILERLKQRGVMRQFPEHISVRNATENMRFFEDAGFSEVTCSRLSHYNILRLLHPLANLPLVGKYFAARLWIVAIR